MQNFKKFIAFALVLIVCVMCLSGCNFIGYDFIDTNYHFDRAIIAIPGGESFEVRRRVLGGLRRRRTAHHYRH